MKVRHCLLIGLVAFGCREADQPVGPGSNSRVEVVSDPAGASIILDGTSTGKVTPDLLRDLSGLHEILVRLDRDGVTYGYRTQVQVKGDSLIRVSGPLTMRCTEATCAINYQKYHDLGDLRISSNPNGALFYYNGNGAGLYYPTGTSNTYVAMGMPVIAMLSGTRDTLALGVYDVSFLAGRPAPNVTKTSSQYTMTQTTWIVPPTSLIINSPSMPTVRGIRVDEELIGVTATNDVAFVKLTFTNITNNANYQATDPIVPAAGLRFDEVYVGMALDPDIGDAADDIITYDPELEMVYSYDMDFREQFSSGKSDKPALVGMRIISASNANRVLNGWLSGVDYHAGEATERFGWGYLSGKKSPAPDYGGTQIGHVPVNPGDYRMSVTAGPLTLAPGESTSVVVAIIVAEPVAGTYQSGTVVLPGDPLDNSRAIAKIAAALHDKAKNLSLP